MNNLTIKSVKTSGSRLTIDFKCRGQISKFFQSNQFYANYNISIENVPEAILVIPFLSAVLPIVWANHAVIHINALDEKFLESTDEYKKALQQLYPKLSLGGRLIVKHASRQHSVFQSKNMMLFSGGIDAQATFIRHMNENLTLVCVHGGDIELANHIAWKGAITPIIKFARNNKCSLRTVRSNFKEMVDFLIMRVYDDCINDKSGWWGRIMHGLAFLGLCAPLSYIEGTRKLYIASSYTSDFLGGWGSHPSLDNMVRWAGTEVIHDGYELSRQKKLLVLAEHFKNCDDYFMLRSCWYSEIGSNCGHCEKCCRTILGLELAGLDPNKYGFKIKPSTFSNIKHRLLNGEWWFGDDQMFMWEDIKRHAHLKKNIIHPEARALIDWLQTVDITSFRRARAFREELYKHDLGKKLNPLFMREPDPIYRMSKKAFFLIRKLMRTFNFLL
ncbi:MAG: hypothetical protein ACFFCD_17870 [Promethearchaeota archaeon]